MDSIIPLDKIKVSHLFNKIGACYYKEVWSNKEIRVQCQQQPNPIKNFLKENIKPVSQRLYTDIEITELKNKLYEFTYISIHSSSDIAFAENVRFVSVYKELFNFLTQESIDVSILNNSTGRELSIQNHILLFPSKYNFSLSLEIGICKIDNLKGYMIMSKEKVMMQIERLSLELDRNEAAQITSDTFKSTPLDDININAESDNKRRERITTAIQEAIKQSKQNKSLTPSAEAIWSIMAEKSKEPNSFFAVNGSVANGNIE